MKKINILYENGRYVCCRCGIGTSISFLIKHKGYCKKCYDIIKGARYENGMRK